MDKTTFLRRANSPFWMGLFMLSKLPAAWFMGIRVLECTDQRTVVCLPYGWRSKNPFRSTYFAAQCAAGELATGLLALVELQGHPPVSMLITHIEADFLKKASQPLYFICEEGAVVAACIRQAIESGHAQSLRMTAVGRLPDQTEAARVVVTWSFKRRQGPRV